MPYTEDNHLFTHSVNQRRYHMQGSCLMNSVYHQLYHIAYHPGIELIQDHIH